MHVTVLLVAAMRRAPSFQRGHNTSSAVHMHTIVSVYTHTVRVGWDMVPKCGVDVGSTNLLAP